MIKTVLKMNIVLFMLILIVSMPLVYADWSELTVTVDTNVVTYEEIAFIQQYSGLYYIDYVANKPYIRTDENIYNQYIVSDFYYTPRDLDYIINGNQYILIRDQSCDGCRLNIYFIDDSDQYYIVIIPNGRFRVDVVGGRSNVPFTPIVNYYPVEEPLHIYIDNSSSNYDSIFIYIYPFKNGESSFLFDVYKSDRIINYINRPAQTYIYERSDYTRIGAIILDSYNNFVDSLLNPLDTITDWLKQLGNYLWSTIKRIIDPEGIFLK